MLTCAPARISARAGATDTAFSINGTSPIVSNHQAMLWLDVRILAFSISYSFERVHCSLAVGVFLARPP